VSKLFIHTFINQALFIQGMHMQMLNKPCQEEMKFKNTTVPNAQF